MQPKRDVFAEQMQKAAADHEARSAEEAVRARVRERNARIRNWTFLGFLAAGIAAAVVYREPLAEAVSRIVPNADGAGESGDPRVRAHGKAKAQIEDAKRVNDARARLLAELSEGK
jgi:hypothetical protein